MVLGALGPRPPGALREPCRGPLPRAPPGALPRGAPAAGCRDRNKREGSKRTKTNANTDQNTLALTPAAQHSAAQRSDGGVGGVGRQNRKPPRKTGESTRYTDPTPDGTPQKPSDHPPTEPKLYDYPQKEILIADPRQLILDCTPICRLWVHLLAGLWVHRSPKL